ncbi:MAG TPA: hypothetical protein VI731_11095 [Bacteroidia bacterium]|nr:hypothetical protein [Bacteroidia bacterium]
MLKKVIEQLDNSQFELLHQELAENRGEKFVRLLELYRETGKNDPDIRDEVGANQAAFYTLKSRLQDKVQQFLFRTATDNRAELLKNISSIPHLVYNSPRETAISMLEHLETELKRLDMPSELVSVYNGLKKLHLNSAQYYHYQQLYNKNVAYALALDKADELASVFTRELCDFLLSRDNAKREILKLYLREMANLSRLYDSHRLKVTRIIMAASFGIFASEENEIPETEETIEDMLRQFHTIVDEHPEDRHYRFLRYVWHFLNYEYYKKLGLQKNGNLSFEKVNASLNSFLLLHHSCPAAWFLLSRSERPTEKAVEELRFLPDPEDAFSFTCFHLALAAGLFQDQKFSEAATTLNKVVNEISFKNYPFAECQVKLFLGLCYLLAEKSEQAEVAVRSISRKLSGDLADQFPAAQAFSRFLKTAVNDASPKKLQKLEQALAIFRQANTGPEAVLKFVKITDVHLQALAKI